LQLEVPKPGLNPGSSNPKIILAFYAPKLLFLLLGRNPIVSSPLDVSNYFPKLTVLNLRNGEFQTLPDEFGDLTNLVYLDLSNCHELQTLPDTIRNFFKYKRKVCNVATT